MLFYAAALQTLNYDWDTLAIGDNASRSPSRHDRNTALLSWPRLRGPLHQ